MANSKKTFLTLFIINTLVSIIYNRMGQSWNMQKNLIINKMPKATLFLRGKRAK